MTVLRQGEKLELWPSPIERPHLVTFWLINLRFCVQLSYASTAVVAVAPTPKIIIIIMKTVQISIDSILPRDDTIRASSLISAH